ncbi:MAG: VIT family protein [Propionibacterium sp.]|jgi:VIT1/CCC1 family predicted Fe2+/Mn2+ transporter|nr:VIT family protein [Propionibacterium sp.]
MWAPLKPVSDFVRDFDAEELRRLAMNAADGIVATAGIVQGLNAADQGDRVLGTAALLSLLAGGIAAASVMYYEASWERDAITAAVEHERAEHAANPEQELSELASLYVARGVDPELARQVAAQLSARDAVDAHVREELGLDADDLAIHPVMMGISTFFAFAIGSLVPLIGIIVAPPEWDVGVTFALVLGALVLTSIVVARAGHTSVWRTALRTLLIGAGAMLLSMAGGELLD